MKRRRFRKPPVSVSLFPFLAVLICTMGTLIVLLVLVVQQARVYAHTKSSTDNSAQSDRETLNALKLESDDFVWRRDLLEQQRSQMSLRLANSRLQLGHLEQHIRQLEQEWKQLEGQVAELDRIDTAAQQDDQEVNSELARLQAAIQSVQDELARVRQQAVNRKRTFAIIPYNGPHSTLRRPIYIECTATGIVLQPEGITLTSADFEGPNGPGNPLDAALRTCREYLDQTGRIERDGEPYPLLVVRPQGIVAYLVARQAIKSWDDEFGYELIDGEMQLQYPMPDPVLKAQLVQAIEDARQRQSILADAMPSRFRTTGGGSLDGNSRISFSSAPRTPSSAPADGPTRSSNDRSPAADLWKDHAATPPRQDHWSGHSASTDRPGAAQTPPGAANASGAAPGGAALSQARGPNWALRGADGRATGITRPIHIACLPHQLVILPQRGELQQTRVIPLTGPLRNSIDDFVTAVWKHTEQWGIAVLGGYWQPVLNVEVGLGGEQRFAELQSLLQGSGLTAKRVRP